MKNYIKFIVIILIIVILFLLFGLKSQKRDYIIGTILDKNESIIEIITENDCIYKIKYKNLEFENGDTIKIEYENDLNNLKNTQNIDIKKISKAKPNLSYSKEAINIVNNMSLEEKVGQLLLTRIPVFNKIGVIKDYSVGGYILFNKDTDNKSKQQLIDEINKFQSSSKIPLFIAIDEEGGTVSRLSSNEQIVDSPFKSPRELYNIGGYEEIKKDSIKKVNLLEELGINLNLAPVADMTSNPNSYMYERSFGDNKEETSKYIKTIFSTQNDSVSYTLKHFPGYGDSLDTHTNVVIDNRSYETIKSNDFVPFKTGIDNDAKAIMVSHNIVTSIDNVPSSLSTNIHNILRSDLNFKGIIITDDLSMAGIQNTNINTPYLKAVLAGNNLLIVTDIYTAYNEIYNGVKEGKISEDLIDRLIIKNIQLKIDKGLYK